MTLTSGSAVTRVAAAPCVAWALAAACVTSSVPLSAWRAPTLSLQAIQAEPVIAAQTDGWDTFTADITVRRTRRDDRGRRVAGTGKAIRYRLERARLGGTWKTTLRMPRGGPRMLTLDGSVRAKAEQAVVSVESDADGSLPRLLDARGTDVAWPDASGLSWLPRDGSEPSAMERLSAAQRRGSAPSPRADGEWMGAMLAARSADAVRRATLERLYGPSIGRVGTLDRFVIESDGRLRETLVDPALALPVEINDTENGALVAHRTFAYVDGPDGAVLRSTADTEYGATDGTGERIIVHVELSNVRFERRR